MTRDLTEVQAEAVEKFSHLKVGALFMACGTGKTQTAVSIINSVTDVGLLYWICPCRVKDNLATELSKCGCKYPAHIVGIESIGCSSRIYMEERAIVEAAKKAGQKVFMIADESIKIKNTRADRTKRVLDLSEMADYKLILNGTPVTKNVMDIYSQMLFLSPKILKKTYIQFRDTYCNYYQIKRGKRIVKTVITGSTNVAHLLSVIAPYVYSCNLQLKVAKRYNVENWYMTADECDDYIALKEELLEEYTSDFDGEVNMLAVFSKLQHSYSLCSGKFTILDKIITDKSIVFCKYIDSEAAVLARYPTAKVLTYDKGSFGLNLQDYNRIIFFDKTFDYAFREQAEGRIFRNGQKLDCDYYDLTGDIGLENEIDKSISTKETLVSRFKKKGNKMSKEELKKLMEKL